MFIKLDYITYIQDERCHVYEIIDSNFHCQYKVRSSLYIIEAIVVVYKTYTERNLSFIPACLQLIFNSSSISIESLKLTKDEVNKVYDLYGVSWESIYTPIKEQYDRLKVLM